MNGNPINICVWCVTEAPLVMNFNVIVATKIEAILVVQFSVELLLFFTRMAQISVGGRVAGGLQPIFVEQKPIKLG